MLDHISTIASLEKEAETIDAYLNITCSEQAAELKNRENDLMVYMARLGKMEADAKYWRDEAVKTNSERVYKDFPSMPASTMNSLIKSLCQRENYLVSWVTRMGRIATHQHEGVRSLLSFERAIYQNEKGHTNH